MTKYWIVASKEETPRLVCLVEKDRDDLHGEIAASKDSIGEQMYLEIPESIVDPMYVRIVSGEDGFSLQNDNVSRIAAAWERVRAERNRLLQLCDWTQLADSPLSTEMKASWASYRQELRDLPESLEDPEDDITWPNEPEA